MFIDLPTQGPALIDDQELPRFWATVWSMLDGAHLAPSTLHRKLNYIEALYAHTESLGGNLDDALAELDLERLGSALEAFFIKLRNTPRPTHATEKRWSTAFHFARTVCQRIEKTPASSSKRFAEVEAFSSKLDNLYLGLRPYKKLYGAMPKALPRQVLLELLDLVEPGNRKNPFTVQETQWRIYALFCLLMYQGLRLGEALSLRADFMKSEHDPKSGVLKYRLTVTTNEREDDPRAEKPNIKNEYSIRTIPVSKPTAHGFQAYLENYRGRVNHSYFLSSARSSPLSKSGATKALERLTYGLSPQARSLLQSMTGATYIRPHALRHTCAVIRMKQLFTICESKDLAMENMRSFFGWSKDSVMPLHYAKLAYDELLNENWHDELDERLSILRSLPE